MSMQYFQNENMLQQRFDAIVIGSGISGGGYVAGSGSYGLMFPDIGVILLNSKALASPASNGGTGQSNLTASLANSNQLLNNRLFTAISGGVSFTINSQETNYLIF